MPSLPSRSDRAPDTKSRRIVLAVALLYALSFLAFYPRTIVNDDESHYVGQTRLLLEGRLTTERIDPRSGEHVEYAPEPYPLGNAIAMAPFVAIGGWRAGFLVSMLSLLLATYALVRWLELEGRSPLFALLLFGYPPALVMGRVSMSDVPSAAIVAGGLYLFWRGLERNSHSGWWLASGFVAGGSLIFRESNPIPFAPFFAGALLRRDRNVWALVAGGLIGLTLRYGSNWLVHGDVFFQKAAYQLAFAAIPDRIGIYLLAILVFVPGGLAFALAYRGRRWPELCIAVGAFFTAYVVQEYYTFATSFVRNAILTPRYLLPLIPVVIFAMAESVPRLWRALLARASEPTRMRLERAAPRAIALWASGVAIAAIAVHPVFQYWSASQARIRDALREQIDREAVLVTNYMATRKFIDDLDRKYVTVWHEQITPDEAEALVDRHGEVFLAILDRSDSSFWRNHQGETEAFRSAIERPAELRFDEQITSIERLRIWRYTRATPSGS